MYSITLSPKYSHLRDFIESLPSRFAREGETIYKARNIIKVFDAPNGMRLNVKCYHAPRFINALVYSWGIRQPKGSRAFTYPTLLLRSGIETPEPVAYIERRTMGILRESYFISVQCPYPNRFYEVADDPKEVYLPLAKAFARFTAHIHNANMLHRDYSPGNILWQRDGDGTYHFSIVDINRMYFGKVSQKMGCRNFARLWGTRDFFETLAKAYAEARAMDEKACVDETLKARLKFWRRYGRHHNVEFIKDL